jgi:hypothetical protein
MTRYTRIALHTGLAVSLPLLTLAGCQSPSQPSALGADAQQAAAYPGTTGHVYTESDAGMNRYVASPAELKVASVSASVNATSAGRAIDNNTNTHWTSGNTAKPTFSLTLSDRAELTSLRIKLNPNVGTYAVEVSEDAKSWKAALSNQKNTTWNVEEKAFPANTWGKHVRLTFDNGGKAIMLFEADVKGGNVGAALPTPAPVPTTGTQAVAASHTHGTFTAARSIDGNIGTEWQSGAVANPSLTLPLGLTGTLQSLGVKTNPGAGTYAVEVSTNGTTWTTALANQSNSTWNLETKTLPAGTQAAFVRLNFANAGKNVMVFELQPKTQGATAPAPIATPAPVATPTPVTPTPTGPGINVHTGTVLHKATSHILGANRNHVTGDFPNGQAKLQKLKELQPTWGERKYLYRIGHGPTDGRNDYSYMTGFHFEKAWNQTKSYPYDDIREGLKEANFLGADQIHVVNFGTSDAAEAGRYVSYLNKAGDANRAKYPFAQQNVREFEIGNEIAWSMVRGHNQYAPNETAYARRAKEFAQAMRKNSDVPIKIGANASINSNWEGNGWSGGATTVKNILQTMGTDVDFLLYHGYPSWPLYKAGDLMTLMAQNEWNRQKIEKEIKPAIKQYAGGRDVYIANTEFFTHLYNDVTRSRGMFGALYSADTLTLAMNQDIRTAVQFAFEHKDMADASFFIGNDPNNTTAIFKFQKMLAQHWGDNIVKTEGSGIPTVRVNGASTSLDMPRLAFSAATSGNKVFVIVTNRTNDADVKTNVNVGFKPSNVTAYELAGSWDAANGTERTIANPSLTGYTFKKASVTIFEISR